jgi:hypothetical protein
VRRFVQHEDYTLRLMQDMELPLPTPYGIVEITPEREYLIIMEFFDGAVESAMPSSTTGPSTRACDWSATMGRRTGPR